MLKANAAIEHVKPIDPFNNLPFCKDVMFKTILAIDANVPSKTKPTNKDSISSLNGHLKRIPIK